MNTLPKKGGGGRLPGSKEKEGSNYGSQLYLLRTGSQLSINKLKGEKLELILSKSPESTRLKQSLSLCF